MDVFKTQKGRSVLTMYLADGSEATAANWDSARGVVYASTKPESMRIADEDANPLDAEVEAIEVGEDIMLSCGFDADPGDGERHMEYQAGPYTVLEPPPEGVASATFDVAWEPVPA